MNATTPPRAWASARTCWQTVVLPDDSGPKISVMRPRGMPPTPSARSSAIEPVGIVSRTSFSRDPSFMIAPRPNCFSIVARAASTALPRSAVFRSAETAERAIRTFPIVSRPIHSLAAAMVTFVTYAPSGADGLDDVGSYGNSKLRDSNHWARQIERSVTDSLSKSARLRRYFTTWR